MSVSDYICLNFTPKKVKENPKIIYAIQKYFPVSTSSVNVTKCEEILN